MKIVPITIKGQQFDLTYAQAKRLYGYLGRELSSVKVEPVTIEPIGKLKEGLETIDRAYVETVCRQGGFERAGRMWTRLCIAANDNYVFGLVVTCSACGRKLSINTQRIDCSKCWYPDFKGCRINVKSLAEASDELMTAKIPHAGQVFRAGIGVLLKSIQE